MNRKEYRKVEILENKKWIQVKFKDLKIDDEFRMFEPDGKPVDGGNVHRATSIPYQTNSEGTLGIKTERK